MIMYSKKILFLTFFVGLALAEDQVQTPSNTKATTRSLFNNLFSFTLDTTQNKNDLKEVIDFAAAKAKELFQSSNKIVPKVVLDYINASEDEKKLIAEYVMKEANNLVNNVGQAAEKYKVSENIRARFYPSTLDLAYYGFVFGSAVFIGFNGLYYLQQKFRDYLAIRKPKYILPLSKIGLFDQYKQKAKTFFYGLKKRPNDVQVERITLALSENCIINRATKKQYYNCVIHLEKTAFLEVETTRLLSNVANNLSMDFIAVPSINLLQKNSVIDIVNELVHIIHKNNRPVLLYIDTVSLLSMDGTEYSEREECIRMIASFLKSSAGILNTKCMIVGVMDNKESLEGPFAEIYTKQVYL